jgi:hypothetical protein
MAMTKSQPEHFDPNVLESFRAIEDQFAGIFNLFKD